jgi:hypothetical protein
MSTTTLITELAEAESQVSRMDADAATAEALKNAARPATRKEVAARAANLRTRLEAERLAAVEAYALHINTTWLATEAVAAAHHALAEAAREAAQARRNLNRLRVAIEDAHGVSLTREAFNEIQSDANRRAAQAARDAAAQAMADLPPVPATFAARFSSRVPDVAAGVRRDAEAIKLAMV